MELCFWISNDAGWLVPPQLAVGDKALGCWKTLWKDRALFASGTAERTIRPNALNKFTKSHSEADQTPSTTKLAGRKQEAGRGSFRLFPEGPWRQVSQGIRLPDKDRDQFLAGYGFPTKQLNHIRSTNPASQPSPPCGSGPTKTRAACPGEHRVGYGLQANLVSRKTLAQPGMATPCQ